MKTKTRVILALTVLTIMLCGLFLSGCGCDQHIGVGKCEKCGKDFFELLKNHCKENGEFKSDSYRVTYYYRSTSSELAILFLYYSPEDDEINMFLGYDESNIMITIDEIDGKYPYIFGFTSDSGKEYTLEGKINASLLSGLTKLPYTYSSAISLLNSSLATLACTTAQLLVVCADLYFIENDMPIRCANLGFIDD